MGGLWEEGKGGLKRGVGRGEVLERKRIGGWVDGGERVREGERVRVGVVEGMGVGGRRIGGGGVVVGRGKIEGEGVEMGMRWVE